MAPLGTHRENVPSNILLKAEQTHHRKVPDLVLGSTLQPLTCLIITNFFMTLVACFHRNKLQDYTIIICFNSFQKNCRISQWILIRLFSPWSKHDISKWMSFYAELSAYAILHMHFTDSYTYTYLNLHLNLSSLTLKLKLTYTHVSRTVKAIEWKEKNLNCLCVSIYNVFWLILYLHFNRGCDKSQ